MSNYNEELLCYILGSCRELVIRFDEKGCINYANDSTLKLTGYEADELRDTYIGEHFTDVFCMKEGKVSLADEYEEGKIIETVLYRKNKTCFPVELNVINISNEERELFLCVALDVTLYKDSLQKNKEIMQMAKDSMKARDEFVANVTHELRTPVNGIKGHADLLMEDERDIQKLGYLKMIHNCCITMEGIINNILDFSKLESGKFQIEEAPFSFRELMEQQQALFTTLAAGKGLKFSLNIAPNVPNQLIGDSLRITQVLNNLVSNAVKFTEQGHIGIEVVKNAQLDGEVELFFVVADTGIGLSEEDKDKIFNSFTQADASITRRFGGTGLGLSITKDLVQLMNGNIWVEGEVGKGSTFSFTIRLKTVEEEAEQEEEPANIVWKNLELRREKQTEQMPEYVFGTALNELEIRRNFEKVNIAMDMQCWQKAETSMDILKQLLSGGSDELRKQTFRMAMAVRKANYEKFREEAAVVREIMTRDWYEINPDQAAKTEE
ncbi:MAG: PAS domain-containing protein [Lachnospiraceae bacterium]|nr:PAS domain-containing protein [Lachnospiraceae bacterium]